MGLRHITDAPERRGAGHWSDQLEHITGGMSLGATDALTAGPALLCTALIGRLDARIVAQPGRTRCGAGPRSPGDRCPGSADVYAVGAAHTRSGWPSQRGEQRLHAQPHGILPHGGQQPYGAVPAGPSPVRAAVGSRRQPSAGARRSSVSQEPRIRRRGGCEPDPGRHRCPLWEGYLTAPAVTPRVRVRWKMRKKTTMGMTPRRAAALRAVGSLVYWPCITDRPRGTVWLSLEISRTRG